MIRWLIFAALLVHVTSAKKSDDGGVGAAKKWPTLHGNILFTSIIVVLLEWICVSNEKNL